MPERFNFARDVIDRGMGRALLVTGAAGGAVSYAALADRSARIAGGLAALGLRPGARVIVLTGREADWFAVMLACIRAGLVALPGTPLLSPADLASRIAASGAEAAIAAPALVPKFDGLALRHRIVAGRAEGWVALDDLAATAPWEGVATQSRDPMLLYFTSGTTAKPKMVPRDHGYALAHALTGLHWMDLRPDDLHWTLTDTGWAKAAWGLLFAPLLLGASVVVHEPGPAFDPAAHLALIGRLGVTTFCAPPTVYRMFAQADLAAFDLRGLRRCLGSGEPLNPEAIRVWREATGCTIADGYGQTESVNLVANTPLMAPRPGSMGRPVPGFDVDVVDEEGTRLGPGAVGHIAVRLGDPHPPGLFTGYVTEGGEDRRAFRHGWYFTGDAGWRDAEGYLWFTGRSDDVILSAGYRISPFEVESTLLTHPAVAESAVVGAPDPVRGEIVRAFVVLARGHRPSEALARALQEHCKAVAAPYRYPREIRFVESLPKTVSGKIRRVELRKVE